ncbi:MAG: hydroxylamine reductase [Candidatus Auribacterota bacterium]|jgi:hydroxylamine reductase|nr:hydroxylamine reductase [Candidatus Auribacterota bacterium]
MSMFCYQCQETVHNTGCTIKGVCGKNEEVANLLDVLVFTLKGISFWNTRARKLGINDEAADRFVIESLFTTITNVNFDPEVIARRIETALIKRDTVKKMYIDKQGSNFKEKLPDAATWNPASNTISEYLKKAPEVGVLSQKNEDIRSLRETLIYGLKGISAYADHAYILDKKSDEIFAFVQEGLAATLDDSLTADDLVGLVLNAGQTAVAVMALLDEANTSRYGSPEITEVNTGIKTGPGILVSGHDLLDLEELLKQTEGKGINIYTHGEMLPANAYPALKKYKHLAGNYGSSWWHQQQEFEAFNGAILMTTNCLVKPKDTYKDRLFTTGVVGWPDVKHIAPRQPGKQKDFSPVIAKALNQGNLQAKTGKKLVIGFAHDTVMNNAGKILELFQSGKLKRFVVMAGCDGRLASREYHTQLAEKLPKDTIILTAGCAKYRYNMLDLGDIDGIPRVLDSGQCNDSYSWAYVALKLKEVLGVDDINDLPISYNVAWYEQKAVAVLLALLSLGVKKIRLCPTAPGFVSSNVLKVLQDNFQLMVTTQVDQDIDAMMAGA